MGGRCRYPCNKIKHSNVYMAKLHLEVLMNRNPDNKMAIYLCEECIKKDGVEIWHVGHIRKNGTVYAKTPDGGKILKKVVIDQDNVSNYLS